MHGLKEKHKRAKNMDSKTYVSVSTILVMWSGDCSYFDTVFFKYKASYNKITSINLIYLRSNTST